MASVFGAIMLQAFYYMIWGGMVIAAVSAVLRGFFWKYIKVRTSFGKFVLVKIRSTLRDYYQVGHVDDGCLVYKSGDDTVRLVIPKDKPTFYRTLAITCIDVDEEKHFIKTVDGDVTTGYDAKKFSDLLSRALMRPQTTSNKEKLMMIGAGVALVLLVIIAYISYMDYTQGLAISQQLPELTRLIKGVVTTGTTNVI